ncbi:hypothetical protein WJX73_004242 [Symbiochloris irregularis]|uniref:Phospholipid/glycerol acyltransferase domain-containing protein n=1 Tax=Symbiochloris irregularis TaxID=706552 RepID=A0AAW1NKF7_9CHLO
MSLGIFLNFPAFLAGALILYWSVPLGMILGKIKPWRISGRRDDAYGWALGLQWWFRVKILSLPGPPLYKNSTCIYLCNHRSWADFYLDVLMTEGHAQMLSRWAVAIVFPMFMIAVMNIRSVVLFNRGRKKDHEEFNRLIDRRIAASPVPGLIVYPEGHRSTKRESLTLKKGMLHYVYSRKAMTQIIITANKEAVISEKKLLARFGQTILVGFGKPIDASKFSSFDDFFKEVQRDWNVQWARVYGADWADAQAHQPTTPLYNRRYPTGIKARSALISAPVFAAFLASIYLTIVGLLRLGRSLGSSQIFLYSGLLVWVGVSFSRAFKPVRLPPPSRQQRTGSPARVS